ncbi:hypothetical protein V1L54_06710 [Streptomyces sp. TRM 70361]|uniref:hypothetical protein n=1 Tax=Streptomyces sp. TRM 70361 TaxID=3116553 RepID=UPI002E7B65BC|nr:hypothetical protein [Streptomyces sp. TRM 70361]MEE1939104.1 hypothetical protein [Streptomyces sp. TRM 70361]
MVSVAFSIDWLLKQPVPDSLPPVISNGRGEMRWIIVYGPNRAMWPMPRTASRFTGR